jgi:hypothetical protein
MAAGHPDTTLDPAATRTRPRATAGLTAEEHLRGFRVRQALKIACASCLGILVPTLLQLQSIYICPLFAFMLLSNFYSDTLRAALEALCVVFVAAAGAVVLAALFGGAPPIYIALMLVWLFAVTLLLDRFPLGTLVGGIIVAVNLFTAIFVSIETVFDASRHFYGLLLLAMVVGVAVDHLLWPPRRRTVFLDVLASIYESLGRGFARLGERSAEDLSELPALLRLHELARIVQSYHGAGLNRRNPLVRLLMHSSALLLHLEFQRREWHRTQRSARCDPPAGRSPAGRHRCAVPAHRPGRPGPGAGCGCRALARRERRHAGSGYGRAAGGARCRTAGPGARLEHPAGRADARAHGIPSRRSDRRLQRGGHAAQEPASGLPRHAAARARRRGRAPAQRQDRADRGAADPRPDLARSAR